MPAHLETLTVDLHHVEIEAVPSKGAYPYPSLAKGAGPQPTQIEVVVLENRWLRATIAPSLGGRIVRLTRVPEQFEGLPFPPHLQGWGRRGVKLDWGIELTLDGQERPNSMGPVDFQLLEEDEGVGVLLGELSAGLGLSWHLRIFLPHDRAALQLECVVLNREMRDAPYEGGILIPEGAAIAVLADPGTWVSDGAFRRMDAGHLAPRQVDSFACELTPYEGGGSGSGDALVAIQGPVVTLTALEPMPDHKVLVRIDGQDLEAKADLTPAKLARFDLTEAGSDIEAVAILSPAGRTRFKWTRHPDDSAADFQTASDRSDRNYLRRQFLDAGRKGGARVALAMADLREGNPGDALNHLDDAHLCNGEDPLVWWLRAAIARRTGSEDPGELLLNAHFLAPFEPLLRAEAFLSTPAGGRQASDIVKPLANHPDALLEVAVRLREVGWLDDLSRWVDECLRHAGHAMLRYLVADALLQNSRMGVEAAQMVSAAAQYPLAPPFPWRPLERDALARLAARFPEDARLTEWNALARSFLEPNA